MDSTLRVAPHLPALKHAVSSKLGLRGKLVSHRHVLRCLVRTTISLETV